MKILIEKIIPNPEQPRREFEEDGIKELAESIRIHGLLQPILVQEDGDGGYVLVAGERRLRAHQALGWLEIEAVVRPNGNGNGSRERSILALVENVQRKDLRPSEEARAYKKMREMGLAVTTIARQCGVSQPRVAGRLAIIDLAEEIQDLFDAELLPVDPRATAAIQSVPEELRVRFAQQLARPGLRIKTVQDSARKLVQALDAEHIAKGEPALKIAVRKQGEPDLPNWDALHQVGKLPTWSVVVKAASQTCHGCVLRPEASVVVCGTCPAVELLVRLIEASHEHSGAD